MRNILNEPDHAPAFAPPRGHARRGVSLIEVQVALVALGILLSGLGPISALYIRQLKEAQKRFDPQTVYYLVPSSDFWVRKLGVAASVTTIDPGTTSLADPLPTTNTVLLESLQKSISAEEVTVQVDVQATQ
jgi:prepilin-type N-terminal cleavage/methylation domain-containing protein